MCVLRLKFAEQYEHGFGGSENLERNKIISKIARSAFTYTELSKKSKIIFFSTGEFINFCMSEDYGVT